METWRIRLSIGLVSLAIILLEIAFMRAFALRFWQHFAHMVISVALLGFGASGVAIALLRPYFRPIHPKNACPPWHFPPQPGAFVGIHPLLGIRSVWMCGLALAFAISIPLSILALAEIPLNPLFLTWDLSQSWTILLFEILTLIPFLFGAGMIGLGLTDTPQRIGGHYAANFVGSGVGAIAGIGLLYVLSPNELALVTSGIGFLSGVLLVHPWNRRSLITISLVGVILARIGSLLPADPTVSEYKALALLRNMPDTTTIARARGPMGQLDVVAGGSLHAAPGLSLHCPASIPSQAVLLVDGDQPSSIYQCQNNQDRQFLDFTTSAVAYHLLKNPRVLIIGAGGGADIHQALLHQAGEVVALEMNPRVIELMRGPLADLSGRVYSLPGVTIENQEARGFLSDSHREFDLIQLSLVDSFGMTGAGLHSSQENYLFTIESVEAMLDRLPGQGILSISRWVDLPPRDGLKIFDTMAMAFRAKNLSPQKHLAMIRSWATVTVLGFRCPITDNDISEIRAFCTERGFDLCYLPKMEESETNRFHRLDRPYYAEAVRALVGPDRETFLAGYPFEIAAATDDKPFFYHVLRPGMLPGMARQWKARVRSFVELGSVLLLLTLIQVIVLSGTLIILPLIIWRQPSTFLRDDITTLVYFLLLGVGFMFLEMGFLQKWCFYLGHPVYAATAVLSGFLLFGGVGSMISGTWGSSPRVTGMGAATFIVLFSGLYLGGLDLFLRATHGYLLGMRFFLAFLTIAPLAIPMGHMFPLGFGRILEESDQLASWAWGINGFASAIATVVAPLLALQVGFSRLVLISMACYAAAGLFWFTRN
ncbi:MAG: hypothetical protein WA705_27390 [Candidatus Ozemobacteraceae bacterium]